MRGSWTKSVVVLGGALALEFASGDASALGSMRCGNDLVSTGDTLYEVRSICGEPDQLDAYVELRSYRRRARECTRQRDGRVSCVEVEVEETVPIQMHRATYDFGSNRFIQYLTFEESRLKDVKSGSYGRKPPASS